jgi:Flp pilus assembly pilin Flp
MKNLFKNFMTKDDGAVTVDWVVLTAAIVALGVAATVAITTGTTDLSDSIWAYMDTLNLFD